MRKGFLAVLIACVVSACTNVPPGYVGVKVNNYGSSRGVSSVPIVTGMVNYNPLTQSVYKFPTFLQNRTWDKTNKIDESITFQSKEGSSFNSDVGLSISFVPDSVPSLYVHQKQDPDHIIDMYARNKVRDAFVAAGSQMPAQDIYGSGKIEFMKQVRLILDTSLVRHGFIIDNLAPIGKFRIDSTLEVAINRALAQTQAAVAAENKVRQYQAEAEQNIAKARGDSAASVIAAAGVAEANRRLQSSLTPALIQYEAQKRWDGKLPQFTGGSGVPFINVTPSKP